MTTLLDRTANILALLYNTEIKSNQIEGYCCRGVFSGAAIGPPVLHLRDNTRSRRQGRRHDPLERAISGLDQQRANESQYNADDDDEMIVAVVLCLCMIAAATTAVTSQQETRREAPGDYRRSNRSYLHNHAKYVLLVAGGNHRAAGRRDFPRYGGTERVGCRLAML